MYPMDGTIEILKVSNQRLKAINAKLLAALEGLVHPETGGDVWARANTTLEAIRAREAIKEASHPA